MKQAIRILGIDPALSNFGFAIADYDVLTGLLDVTHVEIAQTQQSKNGKAVRKCSDDLARGRILVREMRRVIEVYKPTLAMGEVPPGCQSARGAFSNGLTAGLLASLSIPLVEVSPNEVKLASTGSRMASKDQMIQWAVSQWPNVKWLTRKLHGQVVLTKDNEHMADACAAIKAGILTEQFAQAVAMMGAMSAAAA